jgi:hypothetical protein
MLNLHAKNASRLHVGSVSTSFKVFLHYVDSGMIPTALTNKTHPIAIDLKTEVLYINYVEKRT